MILLCGDNNNKWEIDSIMTMQKISWGSLFKRPERQAVIQSIIKWTAQSVGLRRKSLTVVCVCVCVQILHPLKRPRSGVRSDQKGWEGHRSGSISDQTPTPVLWIKIVFSDENDYRNIHYIKQCIISKCHIWVGVWLTAPSQPETSLTNV